MKKKIVVIGGGLAGLTTAFYLSRNKNLEIDIYEAQDRLGGRVQTEIIDGFKFNYGAFMIFPWYHSFHNLLHELNYDNHDEHLIGKHEYAWNNTAQDFQEINQHWVFEELPLETLIRTLPSFLTHKSELYNPDTKRFNMLTVGEYFQNINPYDSKSLDVVNKIAVGYTYGAISQLPMSIYFGFARELVLGNGFKKVSFLLDGANKIIALLQEKLSENNVRIHLSAKVAIDSQKKITIGKKRLDYDFAVIATGQNNLIAPLTSPIKQPIIYNNHFVAHVQTEKKTKVADNYDWNIVYTASMSEEEPQLTSVGNLESTFPNGPEKTLITYLRIPPAMKDEFDEDKAGEKIKSLIQKFFPDAGNVVVDFIYHWKETMPLVSIEALQKIQEIQGDDGVYFAGDYMGAPSMEVAIRSGEEVASVINNAV